MSITSKQLAQLAGVSRGTVDRALNRRGGVNPEVQKRIEELAKLYGYRPNRAGRALVIREPVHIGVLINSVGNPFFDEVKRGLEAACREFSDFSVELHWQESKGYSLERQLKQIEDFGDMAGLIIAPMNQPEVADRLNAFIQQGNRPVVTLNTDLEGCARLAYVGCHYLASGQTAAHIMGLITGGRAQILVVTGSLKVLGHNQRVYGFSSVMQKEFPQSVIVGVVENNDDDQLSADLVAKAIKSNPSIDALYFSAAGVKGGVEAALSTCSRPPVIVTCDLTPDIRRMVESGVVQVTVDQEPYWQGYTAMKTLLDKLLLQQDPAVENLYAQNCILTKYNLP